MNRYAEMKARHQKEFNELPIGWGFDREQFDTMMKGWGLDPDKDRDKIDYIGGWAYIQKKDFHKLQELTKRQKSEIEEAIAGDTVGDGFIYEMFLHKILSLECSYTMDADETIKALGYSEKWIEDSSNRRFKKGFYKALNEIRGLADEPKSSDILNPQGKKKSPAKVQEPDRMM